MAYLPGPLLLQNAGHVGIATSNYNFAGDAADQLGGLDATLGSWDPFLDDIALLMAEPSDPFPGVDVDGAILTLHAYSDPAALLGSDALLTALGDAEISLGTAIGAAPAEAWVDSSTPFVAPAPAEVLGVPVIPPGAISFTVTGDVGGNANAPFTLDGLPATAVTFTNVSQYGNVNFRVRDEWQLTATGTKGQIVYAYAVVNGKDIGGGPQGTIGSDGKLVITGTMGETQVGVWQEQWWIGYSQIATFNFIVVDV